MLNGDATECFMATQTPREWAPKSGKTDLWALRKALICVVRTATRCVFWKLKERTKRAPPVPTSWSFVRNR